MQLTKNFHIDEFACKDGTPVPNNLFQNVYHLAVQLQKLRDHLGVPIIILSGYRTETHNTKVGGSPKSQHKTANAGDIRTKHHTPKELKQIIEELIEKKVLDFTGVGLYKTFVHVDRRAGAPVRWFDN